MHSMKSLIGYFHLDPNRVFDLVLEAYERCLDHAAQLANGYAVAALAETPAQQRIERALPAGAPPITPVHQASQAMGVAFSRAVSLFPPVMEVFRARKLAHILGAKFQRYSVNPAPGSLYRLAAVMMAQGLLEADDILPHLGGKIGEADKAGEADVGDSGVDIGEDAENRSTQLRRIRQEDGLRSLTKAFSSRNAQLVNFARGYGIVSLSQKRSNASNASEAASFVAGMGLGCVAAAVMAADKTFRGNQANQHLGLLQGLLECGSWPHAVAFMQRMSKVGADLPLISANHVGCAAALGSSLHLALDALYRPLSPRRLQLRGRALGHGKPDHSARAHALSTAWEESGTVPAIREWETLLSSLLAICRYAGYMTLARDPTLLTKVCRLLRVLVKRRVSVVTQGGEQAALLGLLCDSVLPAIGMMQFSSPGHVNDLWSVMKHLPFHFRYKVYETWHKNYDKTHADMFIAQAATKHQIRAFMKRASAEKDRCRIVGRQLAKVTHGNPAPALECIIGQVERYDNLIQVSVKWCVFYRDTLLCVCIYVYVIVPRQC